MTLQADGVAAVLLGGRLQESQIDGTSSFHSEAIYDVHVSTNMLLETGTQHVEVNVEWSGDRLVRQTMAVGTRVLNTRTWRYDCTR